MKLENYNTTEIKKITRDCSGKLSANKMENLEEMDKFLEIYDLRRLNQEEIKNMNRSITNNEIESVIQKNPQQKKSGLISFTGEFTKHLEKS